GDGKREEIDKAFGVLGVVTAHGKAGEVGAIEREGRLAAHDVECALPQLEADRAGDTLLRYLEETVERQALRREPHAVVDKFGIPNRQRLLQMRRFTVDRKALEFAMRGDKQCAAGSFVRATGLHTNEAIFDEVGAANTVTRRNFV